MVWLTAPHPLTRRGPRTRRSATLAATQLPRPGGSVADGCRPAPRTAKAGEHHHERRLPQRPDQPLPRTGRDRPRVVRPLIVALAAAVPFVEGEVSSMIGIIGGLNPFVAAVAGIAGNLLCVVGVVLATARVRSAVVARVGRGGEPDEPAAPQSKGRQRFARLLTRFGVPVPASSARWRYRHSSPRPRSSPPASVSRGCWCGRPPRSCSGRRSPPSAQSDSSPSAPFERQARPTVTPDPDDARRTTVALIATD